MENNERLENYIANQRRGNMLTTIAVLVFLALAGTIVYFATRLKNKEQELSVLNARLEDFTDSLRGQEVTIRRNQELCDSGYKILRYTTDSLLSRQNHVPVKTEKQFGPIVNYVDVAQNILKEPTQLPPLVSTSTTIYLHYQPEFANEEQTIAKGLNRKKYEVSGVEQLELNYNRQVRYFNKADERTAGELAAQLQKITGNVYQTNYISNTRTPAKQMEVWIGEKLALENRVLQYRKMIKQQ